MFVCSLDTFFTISLIFIHFPHILVCLFSPSSCLQFTCLTHIFADGPINGLEQFVLWRATPYVVFFN